MRRIVELLAVTALLAGCAGSTHPAQPQPCRQQYAAARCLAMAALVVGDPGLDPANVTSVEILPEPTPVSDGSGGLIIQNYGGGRPIPVRVTLADGSTYEMAICSGLPSGPACTDDHP